MVGGSKAGWWQAAALTRLLRWLSTPTGWVVVQALIVVLVIPVWPLQELSHSYRWRTTPYLQTFTRVLAFLGAGPAPSASPLSASDSLTADPDSVEALWVAKDTILKRAAADGSHRLEIPDVQNIRALAIDSQRGVLWAYGHYMLRAYLFEGTLLRSVPVFSSGNGEDDDDRNCAVGAEDDCAEGDEHVALAVNATNGTVWLGTNTTLRHFSSQGEVLATLALPYQIQALAFDRTRARLWVGTTESVSAYNDAGRVVQTINLGANPYVQDLALRDAVSGELWVALKDTLRRYSPSGTLLQQTSLARIEHLASDGQGHVWVATDNRLLQVNLAGTTLIQLNQFSGESHFVALVADPVDLSLWAASTTALWHVSAQGQILHTADLYTGPPIQDLTLYVDTLAPLLTITAPANGAAATIAPSIELSYSDVGSGVDTSTLLLEANGSNLAVTCTFAATRALCTPHMALPDGPVTLAATIEDFGGRVDALQVR
jgi:hypothetical protein